MGVFLLLLAGLNADRFDTRQAVSENLERLWPLSAPAVLWGIERGDPEVRYRCSRVLDKQAVEWSVLLRTVRTPAVMGWLGRNSLPVPDGVSRLQFGDLVFVACYCGLTGNNEIYDSEYESTVQGGRYELWARAQAVRRGVSRKDAIASPVWELLPKSMQPGK